jgi:hypothetical protein
VPETLIAILRSFFNPDSPQPPPIPDPAQLLPFANAHAVTPILYLTLRDPLLKPALEDSARISLAQSGELVRVASLLQGNSIPFAALKGPMLSQFLYSSLGTRSSGDIDILVRPGDVSRIRSLFIAEGYRLHTALHWPLSESAVIRSRDEEISFESASGVTVDVHWRLMPRYSASVFDRLTGWESLTTIPLASRPIPALAPEPLFLFLAAHGAKHMFERLGWICDIARFLQIAPDLDWPRMIDLSRRTNSLRQLRLAVYLAHDLLGAPVPPELGTDSEASSLAALIKTRILSGALPPVPAVESNRYMLRLLETRSDRLRYLAGLYLVPAEADFRALRLPPALFFLYYAYRPIRLFWRTIVGTK